ncbi:MAG: hypothetical protein KAS35_00225 [Candidatus Marinimicrobia bacterium]|nr:hypothetical protein [Candidatus Neomarinimicrobiota bacterium]
MNKTIFYWLLAILITLSAAIYQRATGPTYPKKIDITFADKQYKIKLPRSHSSTKPCLVSLEVNDNRLVGKILYKRYPSSDVLSEMIMERQGENIIAQLPNQSAAGKLEYHVLLNDIENNVEVFNSGPVVIRFKGDVPASVLIPHIFFMFFAMLFSNLTGLLALGKKEKYKFYTIVTTLLLLAGGMILGPVVQKFAFSELWTGIPFGWDLTDNKTLVAFVFWVVAVIGNWKKDRPYLSLIAAIVLLLVYSIPHSMFGSELDYSTGVIGQG